jgi:hypothetical protein
MMNKNVIIDIKARWAWTDRALLRGAESILLFADFQHTDQLFSVKTKICRNFFSYNNRSVSSISGGHFIDVLCDIERELNNNIKPYPQLEGFCES